MKNLKEGMEVTVSVCELYKKFGESLDYHNIRYTPLGEESDTSEYYDLLDGEHIVCMDGETCTIDQIGEFIVTLRNENGECTDYITLTKEEVEVGVFVNP